MQCNCTILAPEKHISSLILSACAFSSVLGSSTKLTIPPAASSLPPLSPSLFLLPWEKEAESRLSFILEI